MTNQTNDPPKNARIDMALFTGLLLVIVTGVVAMGAAIYITGDGAYLWSLILVGFGLTRITNTTREFTWKPAVVGLAMGILYLVIAAVVWFTKNGAYLWAMLLVHWIADKIVSQITVNE